MKQSLVAFLCFLLAAAFVVVAESVFLLLSFDHIRFKFAENTKQALTLAKREAALEQIEGMRATLEAQTSTLLAGYGPEPPDISQETFGELFVLGVQISRLDEPANKITACWTYKLSSTTIEYHRLMPAIAALENQYPLGRFLEIDLKSTRPPFALSPGPVNFTGRFAILRGRQ
ncbi:MAG TPA: hypothetical protein VE860_13370 [Chthoniobacterales bacterium]|jgi:hypothetical protein|nr:hypothetical protein [Chthoniobacterales bacterium]